MSGLVHVYTGNGKGKTTAALGLCLRALGRGFEAYFIQFLKGNTDYGEARAITQLPGFHLKQFGRPDFVDRDNLTEEDYDLAHEGMKYARRIMGTLHNNGRNVIMVLDELNVAMDFHLIPAEQVLALIESKPTEMELIITGRNAPQEIIDSGDYVTEMREIRHPYQKGIYAREGIEH